LLAWAATPAALPVDPIATRLAALDSEGAAAAVGQALGRARRQGGMVAARRDHEAAFLALVAQGAGLALTSVEWSEAPESGGPVPVHARLRLQGDSFGLPAVVDGLHRQQDAVRLTALEARLEPDGTVDAHFGLLFLRPAQVDGARVAEAAAFHVPADPQLPGLLVDALELSALRQFAAQAQEWRRLADADRRQLLRSLPGPLVALHRKGGSLRWSPGGEVEARPR
jgi:hypothetical protein